MVLRIVECSAVLLGRAATPESPEHRALSHPGTRILALLLLVPKYKSTNTDTQHMQDLYVEQKPISESDAEQMLKVLVVFLDELEGQTNALRLFLENHERSQKDSASMGEMRKSIHLMQDDIRRSVAFIRSATRSISDVC